MSAASRSRRLDINRLYTGYKQLAKTPDEMIMRVFISLPTKGQKLKPYKASLRHNLGISTFTAAFLMTTSGNRIEKINIIAYGGVGPVVLSLSQTEVFLTGKLLSEDIFRQVGKIALSEITPLSDVRGSRAFRNQLAENILLKWEWNSNTSWIGLPTPFLESIQLEGPVHHVGAA